MTSFWTMSFFSNRMDKRKSLLYAAFICTLILAALQYLSFVFYLSWTFWWFDFLMHFFAGVTGGLATYWVLFHSGFIYRDAFPAKKKAVVATLICLMIAGVGWEIAEQMLGITDSNEGHRLDIADDLLMDALGAISAAVIARRRSHGSSNLTING